MKSIFGSSKRQVGLTASAGLTHLDFTTVLGAARAIDNDRKKELVLSNLLSLSHFVEAIVIHENLQYELGRTPDFDPYIEALHASYLGGLVARNHLPVMASDGESGSEDLSIEDAARWAVSVCGGIPADVLLWAVNFRSLTYDVVTNISDNSNPITARYIEVARQIDDEDFQSQLAATLIKLNEIGVGVLGIHVLMRIRLLHTWLGKSEIAYSPHFSRQPIIAKIADPGVALRRWTMEQLADYRTDILVKNHPKDYGDSLSNHLSPVFLACLEKAKSPVDILSAACDVRNSAPAKDFRKELREALSTSGDGGMGTEELYRVRIREHMKNLNDFLFERGTSVEYRRTLNSRVSLNPFDWSLGVVQSTKKNRFLGDKFKTFLSNIVKQSLGIRNSEERIQQIFGTNCRYDMAILGNELPKG